MRLRRPPPSPRAAAASFVLRGRPLFCTSLVDVAGREVLNIGCSFGWFERYALEHGAASVVGVDVDAGNVAAAAELVPAATFLEASVLDLPFPDERFDLVTMFDVIEHVPARTEPAALREVRRVLRPGGELALTTPLRHWLTTVTDPAWYLGHRHYTRRGLLALVEGAGLVPLRCLASGGLVAQADMLAYYASRHLLGRERHPFRRLRDAGDREWTRGRGIHTLAVTARREAAATT